MGNDVRASFVISQRKWRAFDAHHNFQNFQKFSTFQNFKIFESFENLKTLKLKILKNFENFENFDARLIRVLSRNFFWDFDKWRARVISHKKLFPQIRASFTHDARARQMRVLSRNFFWDVDKWRARVRCAEIRVFYHRPQRWPTTIFLLFGSDLTGRGWVPLEPDLFFIKTLYNEQLNWKSK